MHEMQKIPTNATVGISQNSNATNVGTSKSSNCTPKTAVNIQQCNDEQQGSAAGQRSLHLTVMLV